MTTTRIPPLAYDEVGDDQRELLDAVGGASALNIFKTMARHPGLFRQWLPFGGKLLQGGKLPPRDRELIILRVAWRCRSPYEWGQHVAMARAAGLRDDEITRVVDGPDAGGWTELESALLRAVDQLDEEHVIDEDVWGVLRASYDDKQLIEVPMLAGHYMLLAGLMNTIGIPLDDGLPELGKT